MQRRSVNNSRIPDVAWETATSLGQVFIQRADPPRLWPFHCDRQYDQDCPNAAGDDRHDWPENRRSETGLEGTELVRSPDENIVDRRDATRISSGVSSWTSVCLTTTLTLSNTPVRNNIRSESQNQREAPKTMVATPNPVTHPSSVRPAWRIGGR